MTFHVRFGVTSTAVQISGLYLTSSSETPVEIDAFGKQVAPESPGSHLNIVAGVTSQYSRIWRACLSREKIMCPLKATVPGFANA